jgi:serine/threonine-protein kinase
MRACPRCYASYESDLEFCGIDGERLVETDRDLLIGCEIDRYHILDLLGRGAMGAVYRARHVSLGRDFALKVLGGAFAANAAGLARFQREAEALSKLRHTNIVGVVDFVQTPEGLRILIMEYLPGRTLHRAIVEEAPFSPERAAKIARQIASGLAAAHEVGLIHRDVKPSNVLLVEEGKDEVVKLLDFGVVALEKQTDISDRLTGEGRVVGTPTYRAPEQSREGPITHTADLYALGVVLYEMLSGKPPFDAKNVAEILVKHAVEPPAPLPPARGIEKIALVLLAKNPAERLQSGGAVVEAIDRALSGAPDRTLTERSKSVTRGQAPPPPKRWPLIAALAGLVVLLAGGFALVPKKPAAIVTPLPAEKQPEGPVKVADSVVEVPEDLFDEEPTVRKNRKSSGRKKSGDTVSVKKNEPLTQAALHRELDEINNKLRAASRELPENLYRECDDEYLKMRNVVNDARTETALQNAMRRIQRLDKRIDGFRRGERVPQL